MSRVPHSQIHLKGGAAVAAAITLQQRQCEESTLCVKVCVCVCVTDKCHNKMCGKMDEQLVCSDLQGTLREGTMNCNL